MTEPSYAILETVSVGDYPSTVAVSPTNYVDVLNNEDDDTVSVIDGTTHNVIKTVPVGDNPSGIAFDSNNRVYVTNILEDTVSVIDGTTHNVIKTVPVGKQPRGVAFDPIKNRILVANEQSSFMSVIDPANHAVSKLELSIDGVQFGNMSFVGVNPVSNRIYLVTGTFGGTYIIDGTTDKIIQWIRYEEHHINAIAVDSSTNRLYLTEGLHSFLKIIDGNERTVIKTIELSPNYPDHNFTAMAVNENLNRIYVANSSEGSVSVISGFYNQIIANVPLVYSSTPVPPWPNELDVNINTGDIYVLNAGENTVSIIDGADNKEIDVDGDSSNGLTRIDLGSSYTYTGCIAMHKEKNRIYVGHNNNLFVIDGDDYSVLDVLDVGFWIKDIAVDGRRNEIYAAAVLSMVKVIDAESGETIADIETPSGEPIQALVYHQNSLISSVDGVFMLTQKTLCKIDPVTHSVSQCTYVLDNSDIAVSTGTNPLDDSNPDHVIVASEFDIIGWAGHYVQMFRPNDWFVQNFIAVGPKPVAVAVNPKTKRIYVLNNGDGTVSVIGSVDETNIIVPKENFAVQDWTELAAQTLLNITEIEKVWFYLREDDGSIGIDLGLEDLPATYNLSTGYWEYLFNSTVLPDGYYVVLTKAVDISGNEEWSMLRPFSIRNWAVIELLPATKNNKAGRMVPVKFALRTMAAVDPNMPFVYKEDLEIKIYKASNPGSIIQTSVFGDSSKDYRIDTDGEKYITNFKTDKKPAEYVVEIWRPSNGFLVGSFTFETVK